MSSGIEEKVVILRSGGERLHAILYAPSTGTRCGVVFCHPLVEERKSAHRVMVEAARACASNGLAVLRFDYQGCGNSTGAFERCSVTEWLNDIAQAFDFLRTRFSPVPIGLLGLRLGATLAIRFAASLPKSTATATPSQTPSSTRPAFLVLWEPVWNCHNYLEDLFRQKLVREMMTSGRSKTTRGQLHSDLLAGKCVDLDGYPFSSRLYHDLENLAPAALLHQVDDIPTFFVHLSRSGRLAREALDVINAATKINPLSASHAIPEPPFWNLIGVVECPETIRLTVKWICGICQCTKEQREKSGARTGNRTAPPAESEEGDFIEAPVSFKSEQWIIRGVIHQPPEPAIRNRGGIVFLHGWSGSGLGPHDMLVHAARHLARLGFTCLRFDFRGRGDSDGNTSGATIKSMTDDAVSAARFLSNRFKVKPLFLVGICSGCKVAIATTTALSGIQGLALWSAEAMGFLRPSTSQKLKTASAFRTYLRKLCQPATWRKLVLGRVNTGLVRKAISGGETPSPAETRWETEILNRFGAWRGDILFVYGSHDPETVSAAAYERFCREHGIRCHIHVVEGANHNFYSLEWEREVLDHTTKWLLSLVPTRHDVR